MTKQTSEQEIRRQVKKLRSFYLELLNYAIVNAVLILVWLLLDFGSSFWPKWVIIVWGAILVIKGYRMGIFPAIASRLHFMSEEWENKKVSEMMGNGKKKADSQRKVEGRTKQTKDR